MTYGGIVIAQAERSLRSFAPWGEVPHLLRGLLPVPRGAERAERSEESPIPNTILIPHSFLAEPAHTSTLSGMQPGKSVLPRSGTSCKQNPRCCWSSCSASPQVPPSAALRPGGEVVAAEWGQPRRSNSLISSSQAA